VSTISTNDLRPGMVLSSDAVHNNGRVLLRGGVTLEHKHIKMFKTWGLVSAEIDGVTQEQVEAEVLNNLNPSFLEAVREELSLQFRHTDLSHPMVSELHRLLVRQQAQQENKDCGSEVDS